ncbi:MAG: hypothetical protein WCB31_05470 [Nitrososphaeraceae archaeon]
MRRYVPHIRYKTKKTKYASEINQEEAEWQREQIHDLTDLANYLQDMKRKKEFFWSRTVSM